MAYADFPVSSLGSLAYAEDDNRHLLGMKAVQQNLIGSSVGGAGGGASIGSDNYCCYVLECDNEVSTETSLVHVCMCTLPSALHGSLPQLIIRQICSAVSEQFQLLLAQREARERQQPQPQPVKPKMLKRLSAEQQSLLATK